MQMGIIRNNDTSSVVIEIWDEGNLVFSKKIFKANLHFLCNAVESALFALENGLTQEVKIKIL